MCDQENYKVEQLTERLERMELKIEAILEYMKMGIKYTPESYEVVKPEEMMPGMPNPVKMR